MNRHRRLANILFLVLAALSTIMLSLPLTAPVQGVKACVSYLLNPVPLSGARAAERFAAVPSGIAGLLSTDMENRRLREDLRRVPLLEAELVSLRRENERLRAELDFKPPEGRILRWARVIERDPANWFRTLMVDVGLEDGVEINAPALGLFRGRLAAVGRVTEMGPHWAKVLLLTDEMSSAAAYLPSQGWEGLVEGQGGSQLRMNYLPLEAKFAVGDMVHTSVTSATFPPDIPIGRVTQLFQQDPFLTFQSATVAPEIEASTLKEVVLLAPKKLDVPAAPRVPAPKHGEHLGSRAEEGRKS